MAVRIPMNERATKNERAVMALSVNMVMSERTLGMILADEELEEHLSAPAAMTPQIIKQLGTAINMLSNSTWWEKSGWGYNTPTTTADILASGFGFVIEPEDYWAVERITILNNVFIKNVRLGGRNQAVFKLWANTPKAIEQQLQEQFPECSILRSRRNAPEA